MINKWYVLSKSVGFAFKHVRKICVLADNKRRRHGNREQCFLSVHKRSCGGVLKLMGALGLGDDRANHVYLQYKQ